MRLPVPPPGDAAPMATRVGLSCQPPHPSGTGGQAAPGCLWAMTEHGRGARQGPRCHTLPTQCRPGDSSNGEVQPAESPEAWPRFSQNCTAACGLGPFLLSPSLPLCLSRGAGPVLQRAPPACSCSLKSLIPHRCFPK